MNPFLLFYILPRGLWFTGKVSGHICLLQQLCDFSMTPLSFLLCLFGMFVLLYSAKPLAKNNICRRTTWQYYILLSIERSANWTRTYANMLIWFVVYTYTHTHTHIPWTLTKTPCLYWYFQFSPDTSFYFSCHFFLEWWKPVCYYLWRIDSFAWA